MIDDALKSVYKVAQPKNNLKSIDESRNNRNVYMCSKSDIYSNQLNTGSSTEVYSRNYAQGKLNSSRTMDVPILEQPRFHESKYENQNFKNPVVGNSKNNKKVRRVKKNSNVNSKQKHSWHQSYYPSSTISNYLNNAKKSTVA